MPTLPANGAPWTSDGAGDLDSESETRTPRRHPRQAAPMGYRALACPRLPDTSRSRGTGGGKPTLGALTLPQRPEDEEAAVAEPVHEPGDAAILDGGIDQTGEPHPSGAPRDPVTGLPLYPTGPLTETPRWKKRNRPKSQLVKSMVLLVALVTIWMAVWLTMESLRPEDRPAEPAPPAPTTVPASITIGPDAWGYPR